MRAIIIQDGNKFSQGQNGDLVYADRSTSTTDGQIHRLPENQSHILYLHPHPHSSNLSIPLFTHLNKTSILFIQLRISFLTSDRFRGRQFNERAWSDQSNPNPAGWNNYRDFPAAGIEIKPRRMCTRLQTLAPSRAPQSSHFTNWCFRLPRRPCQAARSPLRQCPQCIYWWETVHFSPGSTCKPLISLLSLFDIFID